MASSQRATWSYSQTETLLDLLIDQQTLNELDSRSTRHDVIYADLRQHLERCGLFRRYVKPWISNIIPFGIHVVRWASFLKYCIDCNGNVFMCLSTGNLSRYLERKLFTFPTCNIDWDSTFVVCAVSHYSPALSPAPCPAICRALFYLFLYAPNTACVAYWPQLKHFSFYSEKQIKEKIRKLKQQFRDATNKNSRSGEGRHDVEHMHKLQQLFGNRPAFTRLPGIGLDMDDALNVVQDDSCEVSADPSGKPKINIYLYAIESIDISLQPFRLIGLL